MRELCGQWNFAEHFDYVGANCLPERYRRAGYETVAIHGFVPEMYGRDRWWSEAGFKTRLFRDSIEQAGARRCGGVFPGACDEDIPAQIGARLKRADRPQLVYWLTLNSHLPVVQDPALGTQDCAFGGAALNDESPLLCPLFLLHHRLADAVGRMAMDPKLPPTDILIVGDHMPPFFERSARVRFDSSHVPWILLRARPAGAVRPPS